MKEDVAGNGKGTGAAPSREVFYVIANVTNYLQSFLTCELVLAF